MLGSAESQVPKLFIREIRRTPTRVITIHQQTDGETTYHGNTALRYASRGKHYIFESFIAFVQCAC